MTYARTTNTTRLLSIILLSALCSCTAEKSDSYGEQNEPSAESDGNGDVSQLAATGCDASLWNHVYDPTRLKKLAPCVSVAGIIEESAADDDGDQHFLLKLDPGQDALANKRNRKKKSGNLVLEIVCANAISLKKAKAACAGYANRIGVPPVGAHVRATGTYVIDSHNGWAEIHPVSKLERM